MPTQKTFKRRVRTRMAKTGESYTAARHQLLRKGGDPDPEPTVDAAATTVETELMTSDAAMRRATGKGHAEWFALLDAWGATDPHPHRDRALAERGTWRPGLVDPERHGQL